MKFKLITFVAIMLSLTVYTIYGGIVDNEESAVIDSINQVFDTVKDSLSSRDIDIIARDNIQYKINNIDITNNSATADIELTGVDLAQSFYEMDMFHIFYRDFSISGTVLFTEPIMDTYSVYTYILYKNMPNTQTSNIELQLNKLNGVWHVTNIDDIYRSIENTSIELSTLSNKVYENLAKARGMIRERYQQEQPDKSFEQYWSDYLFDFITNRGYVTQFPFEEQQF